jgi:DnaJ-class molecular chaperone
MNSEEFGDLYATIEVRLPDSLSEDEEDLYNKLRDIGGGLPETRSGTGINDAELRHT